MSSARQRLNLIPRSGALARRSTVFGIALGVCISISHLVLGVILPPQGPSSGFLLAFYASAVGEGQRGLNFQWLQYLVLSLTALFVLFEMRAAFRDSGFCSEFEENFLKLGSGWQVARSYFGLAFGASVVAVMAFLGTGSPSSKYDAMVQSHIGSALMASATAYLVMLVMCHFAWMLVYLVHPARRRGRAQS